MKNKISVLTTSFLVLFLNVFAQNKPNHFTKKEIKNNWKFKGVNLQIIGAWYPSPITLILNSNKSIFT